MLLQRINTKISELKMHSQQLPHKELHALCLRQEKAIMEHIMDTTHFNLYAEIAKICPTQADLSTISNEEVTTRIQLYNNLPSDRSGSFNRLNNSPDEEEEDGGERQSFHEQRAEGFCTFSQPSIRDFLDDVEDSSSFWNNAQNNQQ